MAYDSLFCGWCYLTTFEIFALDAVGAGAKGVCGFDGLFYECFYSGADASALLWFHGRDRGVGGVAVLDGFGVDADLSSPPFTFKTVGVRRLGEASFVLGKPFERVGERLYRLGGLAFREAGSGRFVFAGIYAG